MGRFLTLLAALPLLLPQGVCACDLLSPCAACAEKSVSVSAAPVEEPCCDCCRCAQSKAVASVEITALHTCQSSPADKDDHLPGCPAEGNAQWKADRTPSLPTILAVDVGLVNDIDVPATVSTSFAPSTHLPHGELPIYLTLLTLRI